MVEVPIWLYLTGCFCVGYTVMSLLLFMYDCVRNR